MRKASSSSVIMMFMDSIIDRFGEEVSTYANDADSFKVVVNIAVSHGIQQWGIRVWRQGPGFRARKR